jgi:hypothetical protein
MSQAQSIPAAAQRDPQSIEMLRVWIAERGLHCSIRVGMYDEQNVDEARAWGILLSDVVRHIAQALHVQSGKDTDHSVADIKAHFLKELGDPTSGISGSFA